MTDTPNDERAGQGGEADKLIAQARQASSDGQQALAFHLYLAAYEELSKAPGRRDEAESVARAAWDIALALNDRRLAETAFEKLAPFMSGSEATEAAKRLAGIAMKDLNAMGIDPSQLGSQMPDLSQLMSHLPDGLAEMVDPSELGDLMNLLGVSQNYNVTLDDQGPMTKESDKASGVGAGSANTGDDASEPAAASEEDEGEEATPVSPTTPIPAGANLPAAGGTGSTVNPIQSMRDFFAQMMGGQAAQGGAAGDKDPKLPPAPHFSDVPGFSDVKRALRSFGIGINPDSELGHEAEEALAYHGIDGQVSLPSVIIRAPEGTDLSYLAYAVAGEMGVPFGQISIRVKGKQGRHRPPEVSVRMRGDIAPMRPGGLPSSCVLFLDDADTWPAGLMAQSRRIADFISTVATQPMSAVLVTVTGDGKLPADLLECLGPDVRSITVMAPAVTERYDAWQQVAASHPSAAGIDVALLAMVSDGMLPDTFEQAVHDACADAWRLGLAEGRRHEVTTLDVLSHLADYAPSDEARDRILDVVEEQFSSALDRMTSEDLALLGGGDDATSDGDAAADEGGAD